LFLHRHLDQGGHTGLAKAEEFRGEGWNNFVEIKVQLYTLKNYKLKNASLINSEKCQYVNQFILVQNILQFLPNKEHLLINVFSEHCNLVEPDPDWSHIQ
jgi:hypothetical protein